MIRVCPHSDAECRHGMGCKFSCATDQYNGDKIDLSATPSLDDILYAFAEDGTDGATLAEYIRRYPGFAGELIDLAQELRAVEADIEAPYTPDTVWETKAWVRFAKALLARTDGTGAA